MKELSIEKMEQSIGGCSSNEAFAYGAAASYYGIKYAQTGNPFYQFQWINYTNKLFSCI
jgi:hypothetical protein